MRIQITATPQLRLLTPTSEPPTGVPLTPESSQGQVLEVSIVEFELGADLDRQRGELDDPRDMFLPDENVFVRLRIDNQSGEPQVGRSVWLGPTGGVLWISEVDVPMGSSDRTLEGEPPSGGWPTGEHRIELYFGNSLLATWTFQVDVEREACQDEQARRSVLRARS